MINRHSSFECFFRGIAQLVEQRSPKPRVESSNLSAPAKNEIPADESRQEFSLPMMANLQL